MPGHRKKAKLPPLGRPGWYRTKSAGTEQLRYFDGYDWTSERRDVPFWADGPEWDQIARSSAYVDSDNGFAVRRYFEPAERVPTRRPKASRRRVHMMLVWILVAAMAAGTIGTAVVYLTQRTGH